MIPAAKAVCSVGPVRAALFIVLGALIAQTVWIVSQRLSVGDINLLVVQSCGEPYRGIDWRSNLAPR